jgi:hypothetical protein
MIKPAILLLLLFFHLMAHGEGVGEGCQFLTIGGGYSPAGNQVSLEKNVLYFQRVLEGSGLSGAPHSIFFADGNSPGRDLQFYDPDYDLPELNEYLALFSGKSSGLWNQYRSHSLKTDGPSKIGMVRKWFNEKGTGLKPGKDRLLLYFTGHGGRGEKKTKENTKMYLWQNDSLRVNELVAELDKIPPEVPVTLVMVQCFSGGFSNIIFKEGDPEKGLSAHARAGFFATLSSRVAAGCTPDIDEANYREYSTYFWEAIYGETRMGKKVCKPDYNGDGVTSFSEAHAYTILHSRTIDIPVKTSDAFLSKFSGTKPKEKDQKIEGLLTADSPYPKLLELAGPNEKAILEGLSKELGVEGDNRGKATRDLASKFKEEKDKIKKGQDKTKGELDGIEGGMKAFVEGFWPEAFSPFHPATAKLLTGKDGEELIAKIKRHRDFGRYNELDAKLQDLDDQSHGQERKWVKCQRLLRALENVAMEANLPKFSNDCTLLARYKELVGLENQTLAGTLP